MEDAAIRAEKENSSRPASGCRPVAASDVSSADQPPTGAAASAEAAAQQPRVAAQPETMDEFFSSRVSFYDQHMMDEVEGAREGYARVAELMPADATSLLDLGCGTGLELAALFERNPTLEVTAIDLCASMLEQLRKKYPSRNIHEVNASYVGYDFGTSRFDAALSFETLHHLDRSQKADLYRRLRTAIAPGGVYIECDYMVETQAEEDQLRNERARSLASFAQVPDEYYHLDIPFTVEHQIELLSDAGFESVEKMFRKGATTIIVASVPQLRKTS